MTRPHTAADSHEIRGLTGIRGFAALLVVAAHFAGYWKMLFPWLPVTSSPISRGYLGVDLFFILSGFILSYVYNAGSKKMTWPEYKNFFVLRFARIYPNQLATLAVLIFAVILGPKIGVILTGSYPFDHLPYQLTMTQCWPIFLEKTSNDWNFPAWSISAEWFAYLTIFPLVVFVLLKIRTAWVALFIGCETIVLWAVFSYGICDRAFTNVDGSTLYELVRVSCEFFAGSMFFGVFLLENLVTRFCQKYLTGLFLLLVCLMFGPTSPWIDGSIVVLYPFLLLGLTSETSLAGWLFSTPPALWLGRISYAIYMVHAIAEKLTKVILPSQSYEHASLIVRIGVCMGHVAIIFLMAVMLYYLVEIPGRNLVRKVWTSWVRHKA
jgi:peptidoglycan/LPS O-acetylase OafA/YrhL